MVGAEERGGKQGDEAVDPPPAQKEGTNTGAPRGHRERGGGGGGWGERGR